MARKRRQMPSRPRTLKADLDSLPQFEPDHTFKLEKIEYESALPFPKNRTRQIRDVLSSAMKARVREACFQHKPTSLERFIGNAMLAIATYESRSLRRRAHDRKRAHRLLAEVRGALRAFLRLLERTVEWTQLGRYLESLFIAHLKQHEQQHILTQQQEQQRIRKRRQELLQDTADPQPSIKRLQERRQLVADGASQEPAASWEERTARELV